MPHLHVFCSGPYKNPLVYDDDVVAAPARMCILKPMTPIHLDLFEAVELYTAKGWACLPLYPFAKNPKRAGWPSAVCGTYTSKDFKEDDFVGIRMTNGLVDIDLDCPEAIALAPYILPETATFGRPSVGPAHWIYQLTDHTVAEVHRHDLAKYGTKIDLRTPSYERGKRERGFQTRFPGTSSHDVRASDAPVWVSRPIDPIDITWSELLTSFYTLACAVSLLQAWRALDGKSSHHTFALAVAGAMKNLGWPEEAATELLTIVLTVAKDHEPEDRLSAVKNTYVSTEPTTGIPRLQEHLARFAPDSPLVEHLAAEELAFVARPSIEALAETADASSFHLAKYPLDEDGVVQLFAERHQSDLAHYAGSWYLREGGWWLRAPDPVRELSALGREYLECAKTLPKEQAKKLKKIAAKLVSSSGIFAISRLARAHLAKEPVQLSDDFTITTNNARINIKTREVLPITTLPFSLQRPINIDYDPEAPCPLFQKFIAECLPDPSSQRYLRKLLGMSLAGADKKQVLCLWHGRSAANGKTTLLELLSEMFGRPTVVKIPIETLFGNKYRTTSSLVLEGARIAYTSEPVKGELTQDVLKELTGCDTITGYELRVGMKEFRATHTLIMASNEMLTVNKMDEGMYRRLHVLDWPVSFSGREDVTLPGKLLREKAGILNWILDGYQLYLQEGLERTPAMDAAIAEMREENDRFGQFAQECLVFGPEHKTPLKELFQAWCYWCDDYGIKTKGSSGYLSRELRTRFPELSKHRNAQHSNLAGCRLRSPKDLMVVPPQPQPSPAKHLDVEVHPDLMDDIFE